MIRVTRVVSAIAAGRILNAKTASSQILGGVVWGIGMALHEETLIDHKVGRIMNANIAEYHVPVNADIHDIKVIFVDEPDDSNPLGVKGLGEIGIVGVAAAIANAVYHATGKRVRDLPITLDKLAVAGGVRGCPSESDQYRHSSTKPNHSTPATVEEVANPVVYLAPPVSLATTGAVRRIIDPTRQFADRRRLGGVDWRGSPVVPSKIEAFVIRAAQN